MPWDYYEDYPRRESLDARKKKAAKRAAALTKKQGELQPAIVKGVKIATTFWGQAWNRNLEQYQSYEYRLPRGRSYVKNGFVLDLRVEKGRVRAIVSGSELYEVTINIDPLDPERWTDLKKSCSGQISSLVGLLQGKLSDAVMNAVTHPDTGLFPEPGEIQFICTCPDDADLCKHCAAAAYGVGARLDEKPELLFLLRGVDQMELIGEADGTLLEGDSGGDDLGNLSDIFGIEIEAAQPAPVIRKSNKKPSATRSVKKKKNSK